MPRGVDLYDEALLQNRLWTPRAIYPKVGFWYDGLNLSNFAYGTGITTWRDIGPRASHATQATAGKQPAWTPNGPNGRPSVRFFGYGGGALQCGMDIPNISGLGWSAAEAYYVWYNDNDPGLNEDNGGVLCEFGTDGAGTHEPFVNNNIYHAFCSTVRNQFDPTPPLTRRQISRIRSASNDWFYSLDEVVIFSTVTNTVSFNAGTHHLGYTSAGSAYMKGYVSEAVVFGTTLSAAEASRVTAYLAWKHGMADSNLSSSNPFKNRPPVIGD